MCGAASTPIQRRALTLRFAAPSPASSTISASSTPICTSKRSASAGHNGLSCGMSSAKVDRGVNQRALSGHASYRHSSLNVFSAVQPGAKCAEHAMAVSTSNRRLLSLVDKGHVLLPSKASVDSDQDIELAAHLVEQHAISQRLPAAAPSRLYIVPWETTSKGFRDAMI